MLQKYPDMFNIIFETVETFLEPRELTLSPLRKMQKNQMYRFFIKYDTFEYTLMSLASPQLRYEMSRFHIEHPVVVLLKKV